MERSRKFGSGRPLYWSHAAGDTERRSGVRSAETAFELLPIMTPRYPYTNVLLVDLATHPRLLAREALMENFAPGIYMTDIARASMPNLDSASLKETILPSGERTWEVTDTTVAFSRYWSDDEKLDTGKEAMEGQHRRLRVLSEGCTDLPINAFPIPHGILKEMMSRRLLVLGDLVFLDLQGVRLQSDLDDMSIAGTYRIIAGVLQCRDVERSAPHPTMQAAE